MFTLFQEEAISIIKNKKIKKKVLTKIFLFVILMMLFKKESEK